MDTKQLEYFVAVAELLNFTKAAEKFFISQTAMSLQIKSLEQSLNCQLFYRNNRKVSLTSSGLVFYKEAKLILSQVDKAKKSVYKINSGYSGILKIGYINEHNTPSMYKLVSDFHAKYPSIDLTIIDDTIENLSSMLANNSLDLIFSIDFDLKEYSKFSSLILESQKIYAIVYKNHKFANKKSIKRFSLKDENLISLDRNIAPYGFDKMIGECIKCGFSPKIVKQCSSIETLLLNVSLNLGISIFPKFTQSTFDDRLIYIPLEGENEFINSIVVWNDTNTSQSLELFINTIQHNYKI